jgi:sterol desaturase/sphingolipid hydroxylase (fatty acid hydroxylase superfamily)
MTLLDYLAAPFTIFTNLSNRMAYIYVLSSLIVAIVVYLINKTRKGEAEQVSLLRWLLPKDVLLHPSSQADYAFFVINKILLAGIYASVLLTSQIGHFAVTTALEAVLGPSTAQIQPHWGYAVLTTLVIILVLDFSLWALHYLFHKVPFLWDYHKAHHSAEVMTPITAARMHPVEEVFDSLMVGVVVGSAYAVLQYILGPAAIHIKLFEINIVLAIFYFSAFHLRHSHVWVRYPYWVQHIFVCPAQHQIHHSVDRKHWDKNMGFIFAFWDWMFGTLYAPKGKEDITFGLGTEEDGGKWHSVGALYFLPFRQSYDRYLAWKARGRGFREPAE